MFSILWRDRDAVLPVCTVIIVVVGCPGIRDGAEDTGETRVTNPAEQSEKSKERERERKY